MAWRSAGSAFVSLRGRGRTAPRPHLLCDTTGMMAPARRFLHRAPSLLSGPATGAGPPFRHFWQHPTHGREQPHTQARGVLPRAPARPIAARRIPRGVPQRREVEGQRRRLQGLQARIECKGHAKAQAARRGRGEGRENLARQAAAPSGRPRGRCGGTGGPRQGSTTRRRRRASAPTLRC